MNRNRLIYLTDLMLIPLLVLSLYTGVELHIAGHRTDHDIWHNQALFHAIVSLLFMVLGLVHICSHRGWFKGLKTKGLRGNRKVVLLLSALFASVIVSGLSLLFFVEGPHSPTGLLHDKTGMAMSILGTLHLLKRLPLFRKGVSNHVFGKKRETGASTGRIKPAKN